MEQNVTFVVKETQQERLNRIAAFKKERREVKRNHAANEQALNMVDIEFALRENKGSVTRAARMLGTTRRVIQRIITYNPHLGRVVKEIKEENKDEAEYRLIEQVESGNIAAISLFLKTQAKERGYTERNTLEHELGEGMVKNSAALIEAMRKGSRDVEVIEAEDYTCLEPKQLENHDQTN